MARPFPGATVAAAGANQVVSRVDVVQAGQLLFTTDKTVAIPGTQVSIVDGSATFDETRSIRGTATVVLSLDATTAALVPTTPTSPFSPVAPTEVIPYVGFIDPATGAQLLTQLGVFEISDVDVVEDGGALTMTLTCADRTAKFDRARFINPYTVSSFSNFTDAITALVSAVDPNADLQVTPTTYATPLLTFDMESTYLDAIRQMCDAIGYVFRVDWQGRYVVVPFDQTGDPVWTLTETSDTRMTQIKRNLSKSKVYNGVVVRGESAGTTSPPVEGQAWDTDPSSPTYYDPANPLASTYGPVPFFYTSQLITTQAQANDAAAARLPKVTGLVERLSATTRLNPAMEPGDLCSVTRARVGASGVYVLESVGPIGLRAGAMQITMRERRL